MRRSLSALWSNGEGWDALVVARVLELLVLLELDAERLCHDDCEGICPVCGEDRNAIS